MDHSLEKRARKQRKRDEKLRHEKARHLLEEKDPTVKHEKKLWGRYHLSLLIALIILASVFFFSHM